MTLSDIVGKPLAMALIALLVCGLAYPLFVTLVAGVAFPFQASGSLVTSGNAVVGSYLVAQNFSEAVFFHPNPSNYSASGIDPTITLADAYSQIPRISNASGLSRSLLYGIVDNATSRTEFLFGTSYVNVVSINMYLIRRYPMVYGRYASG